MCDLFNPKLFQPREDAQEPQQPARRIDNGKVTLTPQELADYMQIKVSAARNLVHWEGFPSIKVAGKYLIPIDPFLEWLDKQARGGE